LALENCFIIANFWPEYIWPIIHRFNKINPVISPSNVDLPTGASLEGSYFREIHTDRETM
jgi:hypothetical protein